MIFNQRGQSETVFEVLITVILLSFVLVIGSYAMTSLSDTQCSKQIDISLSNFSQAIEKTSSSSLASQFFFFDLPNCFGPNSTITVVKYTSEPRLCASKCPGSMGSCVLLRYDNQKDPVSPTRYQCVNISPLTLINDNTTCTDSPDNYSLKTQDTTNTTQATGWVFNRGHYLIKSVSLSTPSICVYERSTGN